MEPLQKPVEAAWVHLVASPSLKTPRVNPLQNVTVDSEATLWNCMAFSTFHDFTLLKPCRENLSEASSTKLSRPATKEEAEVSWWLRAAADGDLGCPKLGTPRA